jgi:hypothetical protein
VRSADLKGRQANAEPLLKESPVPKGIFTKRDLIIIAVFVACIMCLPMLVMQTRANILSAKTLSKLDGDIRHQIETGDKTILYMFTPTCEGCRVISPMIDSLWTLHPEAVYKVDASKSLSLTELFNVPGVPFTVLIENGRIVDVILGIRERNKISAFFL